MITTRHAVTVQSDDQIGISEATHPLAAGEVFSDAQEFFSCICQFGIDFAVSPPQPLNAMGSCPGTLIDVITQSADAGLEISIDESFDGQGVTPPWVRMLTVLVMPGIPSAIAGFRRKGMFARVNWTNTTLGVIFFDGVVKYGTE